jgi:hypothetical protein
VSKSEEIRFELEVIAEANDGLLRAEDVVEFARDENTALHKHFQWDDTEAARQYRIIQARNIIRVVVVVTPEISEPYRVAVSMENDRYTPGGGYRLMKDVMSDEEKRTAFVAQAKRELDAWRNRYKHLKELADIFAAIDKANGHGPGHTFTNDAPQLPTQ